MDIQTTGKDLLVLIDIQFDFLAGGSLAVPNAEEIIQPVSALADRFDNVVLTQDWHPADHSSFASNHEGKAPFDVITMPYGEQVLWPDHCLQGKQGANLAVSNVISKKAQAIIRKGFNPDIDSYSAFMENDQLTNTGLAAYAKSRGFEHIFFAGLALDYCVGFSALDARKFGFEATVVLDACRGISDEGVAEMKQRMEEAGVNIV
jgi:nicotinamidase/pyrazinamidase